MNGKKNVAPFFYKANEVMVGVNFIFLLFLVTNQKSPSSSANIDFTFFFLMCKKKCAPYINFFFYVKHTIFIIQLWYIIINYMKLLYLMIFMHTQPIGCLFFVFRKKKNDNLLRNGQVD